MFLPEKLAQNRGKLALWRRAVFGAANHVMTGYNRLADYSNRRSRHVFDRRMGTAVPEALGPARLRELTGVPLLLNTSFNGFLNTQIDLLVLGDTVVEKHPEVAALLLSRRTMRDAGRVIDGQISAA
jgi:hypothetical protein